MGPCPFRHGYSGQVARVSEVHVRFNGAMPFQAWIPRIDFPPRPQHLCFNGAMPFQAWIPGLDLTSATGVSGLQWGHALSGMDTSTKWPPSATL